MVTLHLLPRYQLGYLTIDIHHHSCHKENIKPLQPGGHTIIQVCPPCFFVNLTGLEPATSLLDEGTLTELS